MSRGDAAEGEQWSCEGTTRRVRREQEQRQVREHHETYVQFWWPTPAQVKDGAAVRVRMAEERGVLEEVIVRVH